MVDNLHSRELPRWLRDFLAAVPAQGTGLHQFINAAAWHLMPWRSDDDAVSLLTIATANCGRNTRREIADAVRSARAIHDAGAGWHPEAPIIQDGSQSAVTTSRWPKRDDSLITGILADGIGQYELWERSPHRFEEGNELEMSDMLALLFPGDPLLCIGWDKDAWRTQSLSKWAERRLKVDLQFIVPSPMSATEGATKEGKTTTKSNANTGPRRYLVVEFDFKPDTKPEDAALLQSGETHGLRNTLDLCACLLNHLAEYGPLTLVVWSGGKSLQGWFPVVNEAEETTREFFHYACLCGADPTTWTPSQFVRLPYGRRPLKDSEPVTQLPIYFNPSLLPS